jgi:hypothetical protein
MRARRCQAVERLLRAFEVGLCAPRPLQRRARHRVEQVAIASRARSSALWAVYKSSSALGGVSSSAATQPESRRGPTHGAPAMSHSNDRNMTSSNGST